jgi:host cell factor
MELRYASNQLQWEIPSCYGTSPPPRESHSAVGYTDSEGANPKLIIFGGMSGCRLGDLWILHIGNQGSMLLSQLPTRNFAAIFGD